MAISPGYMGIATVGGIKLMCTDFNVNLKQEALYFNHTIGLRDTGGDGIMGLHQDGGTHNKQNMLMRPGPKIIQGGVSFNWTLGIGDGLYNDAKDANDISMSFQYGGVGCGGSRSFQACKINSYTFRASAGEIATGSLDIMGKQIGAGGTLTNNPFHTQLITWDQIKVTSSFNSNNIASIEFTIQNGCFPIYTASSNTEKNLLPKDIRVGIQKLTGSIGVYDTSGTINDITEGTLNVVCGGMNANLSVLYLPTEMQGSTGPVIKTIKFVGKDENET